MNIKNLPIKKEYTDAWRKIKSLPDETMVTAFNWWPEPAWKVKRDFTDALHARINDRGGLKPHGRKDCRQMETDWQRDQRALESIRNRVRVYQFNTPECRSRFSNLLSRYDD